MKALIIEDLVYIGTMDFIHCHGQRVKRLIIKEADNLAITPFHDEVYAFTGYVQDECSKVVGEVEIPKEMVEKALAYILAKREFDNLKGSFEALFH